MPLGEFSFFFKCGHRIVQFQGDAQNVFRPFVDGTTDTNMIGKFENAKYA